MAENSYSRCVRSPKSALLGKPNTTEPVSGYYLKVQRQIDNSRKIWTSQAVIKSSNQQPHLLTLLFQIHCLRTVVTKISSEFSINTFISRHHLTRQAQEDLLGLIQLHMPSETSSSISSSVFTLRKHSLLNPVAAQNEMHFMCPQCWCVFPTKDSHPTVCPNTTCAARLDEVVLPYFITVSIAEQLQVILKSKCIYVSIATACYFINFVGEGVFKSILAYKRQQRIPGCLTDMRDGSLYRELIESNQLSADASISVTITEKNSSIWPVLLMINELPFVDRYMYNVCM